MSILPKVMVRTLLALPLVAVVVLGVEAVVAINREYVEVPDFEVDFTTAGRDPALRMAVLGDSTVAGLGASSARASLSGQIALQVTEATGRAVSVEGYGVSGARTSDVVQSQLAQLDGKDLDVIVVEIGSNDVTHGTSLGAIERQTRTMLVDALERAPIVVLGSAGKLNSPNFLPPLRQVVMWRATAVREQQAAVAVDLGVPFMNVARDVSPAYDRTEGANSSDKFHPSDIGYEIWARPLAKLVVEALEEQGDEGEGGQ